MLSFSREEFVFATKSLPWLTKERRFSDIRYELDRKYELIHKGEYFLSWSGLPTSLRWLGLFWVILDS